MHATGNVFGSTGGATSGGGRSRRVGGVGLAVIAMVATLLTGVASPGEAACTEPGQAPVIRRLVVTQGASTYTALSPGKATVVHGLMTPTNCSTGPVTVTSATLRVTTSRGTTQVSPSAFSAASLPATVDPAANVNPRFNVPASLLAGVDAATFQLSVTYQGGAAPVTRSVVRTFTPLNPIRVLAVPMGNGKTNTIMAETDRTRLSEMFNAMARLFPVSGAASALTGSGGIRWHLSSGAVDLGPNGLNLMDLDRRNYIYCGRASQFDSLAIELTRHLTAHNSDPLNVPVDFVVGVVPASQSSSGAECDWGRAQYPGKASWVTLAAGPIGYVGTMELAHNIGLVPHGQVRNGAAATTPHTPSSVADATGAAYHIATNAWIGYGQPALRIVPGASDDLVLLEGEDWEYARCTLAGPNLGICGGATQVAFAGEVGNAPARDGNGELTLRFRITARLGHDESAFTSHFTRGGDGNPTPEQPGSPYILAYRGGTKAAPGAVVKTFAVPYTQSETHHAGQPSSNPDVHVHGEFDWRSGTELVELWRGQPGASGSVRLYQAVPTAMSIDEIHVVTAGWDFAPHAATPADETDGTISFDASMTGYVERSIDGSGCDALVVRRLDTGAEARHRAPASACSGTLVNATPRAFGHPSFSTDGRDVAFECGPTSSRGDLCIAPVLKAADGSVAIGAVRRVYACQRNPANVCVGTSTGALEGGATGVSWSPVADPNEGRFVVFSVDGDVFRLFPDRVRTVEQARDLEVFGLAQQITATPQIESGPAVSPDGGSVVYRSATETNASLRTRAIHDAQGNFNVGPEVDLGIDGHDPAWTGELVLFSDTASGVDAIGTAKRLRLVDGVVKEVGPGKRPAAEEGGRGKLIVTRSQGAQRDVFIGTPQERVDIVVEGTAADPAVTQGFVYLRHQGVTSTVAVALPVTRRDPTTNEVRFSVEDFDASWSPKEGVAVAGMSDGVNFVLEAGTEPVTRTDKSPAARFVYPRALASFDTTSPVAVLALGWDAEGQLMPGTAGTATLAGPGLSATSVPGGVNEVAVMRPQDFGLSRWNLGTYTVTATFTDAAGQKALVTQQFRVDGIPADIHLDPTELNVTSSGNYLTAYVRLNDPLAGDLLSVRDLRISEIGGVSTPTSLLLDKFVAASYEVTGTGANRVGVAKFDRQAVNEFLQQRPHLVGSPTPFLIGGTVAHVTEPGARLRFADTSMVLTKWS